MRSLLIETAALAAADFSDFRVVETAMTPEAFDAGHIPGSVFWPASEFLMPDFRLRTDPEQFAELLSRSGITPDTVIVCSFGGDPAMAGWAAWLFWILTSYGHGETVVLNGGTPKWRRENRPLTTEDAHWEPSTYPVPASFDSGQRAVLGQVRAAIEESTGNTSKTGRREAATLLDARSEKEFRGEHFFDAPPKPGEETGHIPGARHVPYDSLLQSDGTYRSKAELQTLCAELGLDSDQTIITYCAVGIRSSLVWMVFKHLLEFPQVRNYDGSWNEWSLRAQEPEKPREKAP